MLVQGLGLYFSCHSRERVIFFSCLVDSWVSIPMCFAFSWQACCWKHTWKHTEISCHHQLTMIQLALVPFPRPASAGSFCCVSGLLQICVCCGLWVIPSTATASPFPPYSQLFQSMSFFVPTDLLASLFTCGAFLCLYQNKKSCFRKKVLFLCRAITKYKQKQPNKPTKK